MTGGDDRPDHLVGDLFGIAGKLGHDELLEARRRGGGDCVVHQTAEAIIVAPNGVLLLGL